MQYVVHIILCSLCMFTIQPVLAMDQQDSSGGLWSVVRRHPVITVAAGALLIGGAFWLKTKWKKSNIATEPKSDEEEAAPLVSSPQGSDTGNNHVIVEPKPCVNAFLSLMDKRGFKEIHQAAAEGKTDLLAALLDGDPKNVDAVGPELITPIMLAAGNGHLETSRLLLERGGFRHPNVIDKKHMTALAYAALYGHMDTARILVEYIKAKHAQKYITDQSFMRPTPLHCAISKKQYPVARYLIEEGASLISRDIRGQTPVHLAVCENVDPEFMEYILKNCDDINVFNRHEETPLDVAIRCGHNALVELLQRIGAKTAEQCKLIMAQEKKEAAYIRWLEREYGDIDMIHSDGHTFLDKARLLGYAATVEVLVKAGAKTAQEVKEIKKI